MTKRGFKERNAQMQSMRLAGTSKLVLSISPSIGLGVRWSLAYLATPEERLPNGPRLLTEPELMEMQ